MAISPGDWASSTDPFILALAHSWSAGPITTTTVTLNSSSGFINGISEDKDIQEIFWAKDTDKSANFSATAVETEIFSFLDYLNEWPLTDENISGSYNPYVTHDIVQQDPKDCKIVAFGKTAGGVIYSLFAYSAFAWVEKDPAQILFSWIAHHTPSSVALKSFLDQSSFEDASDYYDENPIDMIVLREVGLSIDDQIKKVMDCTSDFLAVRPGTDGVVSLSILPRRSALTDRTTVIDLDSESVSHFTIRPTDMFTLDEVVTKYGNSILQTVVPLKTVDLNASQPPQYVGDSINTVKQKVGGADDLRTTEIDAKYITARSNVLNHLDIGFWKNDQDELEVEFTDLTHLNFEVGDKVHFIGRGYDGTEDFVCTEKPLDIDSMKASARFIQIHGIAGKTPKYADESNLILSLRTNAIGDNDTGVATFPADVFNRDVHRSLDRWWDESGNYYQAVEHIRGTPPGLPSMTLNERERWPGLVTSGLKGLEFVDDNNSGYNKIGTGGTRSYTLYWVGEIAGDYSASAGYLLDCNGADDLIFAVSGDGGGSGAYNKYQFYDGLWRGSVDLQTGWQILVYVLTSGSARIRRNGVDIETGLSYSPVQIDNAGTFGLMCSSGGTFGKVNGTHMEFHLFELAHLNATIQEIEAHLSEKYNIPI